MSFESFISIKKHEPLLVFSILKIRRHNSNTKNIYIYIYIINNNNNNNDNNNNNNNNSLKTENSWPASLLPAVLKTIVRRSYRKEYKT